MKALFKHLNFHIFQNTLLSVLFTVPQVPLLGSISNQKVLAQTQTSCPAGSTQATLNWGESNFQTANFNQTFNIGGVNTRFQMTENPAGIIRDESPQNSPGNLGDVPYGVAPGPYGGINRPYLRWGIDARGSSRGGNATLTITFARPVTLPTPLTFLDVDRDRPGEPPYQDQITVTASNQGQNVPVTLANIGPGAVAQIVNNNTARGAEPRVPPGNALPEQNFGNVFATISQPVTQIQVVYQSGPLYREGQPPGQDETIGLADLTICVPAGSIGDTVFTDRNSNGQQDAGETGIANATLTLRNSDGQVVGTTQTDNNGRYLFTGLQPGNYTVEVTRPSDFTPTTETTLSANVSDANPQNLDVDFGFRPGQAGAAGDPNLRLVKRITNATRNGQPISGLNFNTFVDDPNDDDDNRLQQVGRSPVGQVSLPTPLSSGDEVEYTIYYLVDGGQQLQNARFCDLIPTGTSYVSNSLSVNGIANQGQVLSPLTPLQPDFANICGNNNKGAVIVGPANIPDGQSGLIRFRVTID
jgi:uncharacterized repeat protein (TIGR01451 family)